MLSIFQLVSITSFTVTGTSEGQCLANKTCFCDYTKAGNGNGDITGSQSKALTADRDKHAFQTEFAERINTIIFTKKRTDDEDEEDSKTFDDDELKRITIEDKNNKNVNTNNISLTDIYKDRKNLENKKLVSAEVHADVLNFTVIGLDYFQDYEFHVSLFDTLFFLNFFFFGNIPHTEIVYHINKKRTLGIYTIAYILTIFRCA